jgi:hypothetical protein
LTGKSETGDEGKLEHKKSDESKTEPSKTEAPVSSDKPKPSSESEK